MTSFSGRIARVVPAAPSQSSASPLRRRQPVDLDQMGHADRAHNERLVVRIGSAAGNSAVLKALQRIPQPGFPDASPEGKNWNGPVAQPVGKMLRLAVRDVPGGNDKDFLGSNSTHTTESAANRAIVIVPEKFNADSKDPAEVLLHFHGHTEEWRGRFAGYRQRSTKDGKPTENTPNDNKVRDVALDQIEQQIEASGRGRMIGVLPLGGEQSQFGSKFDADTYVRTALAKASTDFPKVLPKAPQNPRLIVSGHSGGGRTVRDIVAGKTPPKNLAGIVLFDAESVAGVIRKRVAEDMAFLTDPANAGTEKAYLAARPVVRVFARKGGKYAKLYEPVFKDAFKRSLNTWLAGLRAKKVKPAERKLRLDALAPFLPDLGRLYTLDVLDNTAMSHEEILRGIKTDDTDYVAGRGTLEKALRTIPTPPP